MPYVAKEERRRVQDSLQPRTPGELNFLITVLAKEYARRKGHSYQTFNDIMGALEGAKLEFYRRVVAPYEDTKITQNGDVYD
jgi:hypothetical protein